MEKEQRMTSKEVVILIVTTLLVGLGSSTTFIYLPIKEVNRRYKALEKADKLYNNIEKLADYRLQLRLEEIELDKEYYSLSNDGANRNLINEIIDKEYILIQKVDKIDSLLLLYRAWRKPSGGLGITYFDANTHNEIKILLAEYELNKTTREQK